GCRAAGPRAQAATAGRRRRPGRRGSGSRGGRDVPGPASCPPSAHGPGGRGDPRGDARAVRIYLLLMAIAAAVTYLATPLAPVLARRTHAVTPVRARDVHTTPVPRLGGVAMLAGMAATRVRAAQIPVLVPVFSGADESLPWSILGAAPLVCVLGVADDIWDLDWLTKMVGQILAAGFMAWQGVQLVQFPVFGLTIGSSRLSLVVTILVVV